MMGAIRRWWRRRRVTREPLESRLQRVRDEEQATADAMGVDRKFSDSERRLRRLRSQIAVYRDDLQQHRGR